MKKYLPMYSSHLTRLTPGSICIRVVTWLDIYLFIDCVKIKSSTTQKLDLRINRELQIHTSVVFLGFSVVGFHRLYQNVFHLYLHEAEQSGRYLM